MTRNIWIGIVVVVILVAGGWWYINKPSALPDATQFPILQDDTTGTLVSPTTTVNKLSASPTSGEAPLSVLFTVQGASVDFPVLANLNFGDGDSERLAEIQPQITHTYISPGTYIARLQPLGGSDAYATVTINVSPGPNASSISIVTPIDGKSVARGGTLTISWNSRNVTADSKVKLNILNASGGFVEAVNDSDTSYLPATGNTVWHVPTTQNVCSKPVNDGCLEYVTKPFPTGRYYVHASLFPPNYCSTSGRIPTPCPPGSITGGRAPLTADSGIFTINP